MPASPKYDRFIFTSESIHLDPARLPVGNLIQTQPHHHFQATPLRILYNPELDNSSSSRQLDYEEQRWLHHRPRDKRPRTTKPSHPIVFACVGQKPDIRLVVFDQEFHAHSTLLKLHSAFFRKFLDSTDKAVIVNDATATTGDSVSTAPDTSLNGSATFKYKWTTKVDEVGDKCTW